MVRPGRPGAVPCCAPTGASLIERLDDVDGLVVITVGDAGRPGAVEGRDAARAAQVVLAMELEWGIKMSGSMCPATLSRPVPATRPPPSLSAGRSP